MFIEEIETNIDFENTQIECKAILNREDILGWLKTIAGFANSEGGKFYIGVEDKTNKLIGFDSRSADNERNYFNNIVNEHLTPRPVTKVTFLDYEIHDKKRFVLRVDVEESSVKPVVLKYNGLPAIFKRRDGYTNGATYEEIIEMSISSKNTQYDVLTSDVKYNKESFKDLNNFYSEHNDGEVLKEKALQSMGFYDENGNLKNGAVLFMDNYGDKKTLVQCSVFSGLNKGSERIVTINKYSGNITSTISYILDFVNQRMNHSIIKLNDGRKNVDAFPKRALFEGIINAIAHRDYYLDGTQIEVDIFMDRLEITSPGGLYRKEKTGKTYDLTKIISKRRNELICNVLVACNVMEASGTGFDKIMEEYKDVDINHKPYIYAESDYFRLVLPDLTYDKGTGGNGDVPSIIYGPVENGSELDEKILSFCYMKARKASEIAEYLGVSDSTYLRKEVLGNLVENGYLESDKVSRTTYYKSCRDTVELL